jgi:RNA polymerase sigma factor (sigma-70 family)
MSNWGIVDEGVMEGMDGQGSIDLTRRTCRPNSLTETPSPELNFILKQCLRWIHRWPMPFHWASTDWREEVAAQSQSAAWQALGEYDASRGVPFSAFVQFRIMASLLTRYRQEWAYRTHCVPIADAFEAENPVEEAFGRNADHTSLRHALGLLPESDRQLLVELFWEDRTESHIAHCRHISQPAVNKRKRTILRHLHEQLDGAKKNLRTGLLKCESPANRTKRL